MKETLKGTTKNAPARSTRNPLLFYSAAYLEAAEETLDTEGFVINQVTPELEEMEEPVEVQLVDLEELLAQQEEQQEGPDEELSADADEDQKAEPDKA